jgi:hypothetical protein
VIEFLKGKKTYIVAAVAFIYGGGLQCGWWPHSAAVDLMLAGAYGAAQRAAVKKIEL